MKRLFIIFVLIIFGVGFGFGFNYTQAKRIALTPLNFDLKGKPGDKVEGVIRVLNPDYNEEITVKMTVEDMLPEGEEGRVILKLPPEEKTTISLAQWTTFDPETFVLEPREEKPVRFTIQIPENADPGGHYAGIIAGIYETAMSDKTGVGIVTRIASLVLLTVEGETIEDLRVVEFTAPSYREYGPVKFLIRFENKGTVHVQPQAEIKIEDIFNKEVAELSVEPRNVLPNSIRKFETEWNQKWLWGLRYKATLFGSYGAYGSPNQSLTPITVTFWAFPWKIVLIIVAVIAFFILTRRRWLNALKVLIKGELSVNKK